VSVVIVSNRVARVRPGEPISGGLAAALLPAVKSAGAIWVGSSGRLGDDTRDGIIEMEALGSGALGTLDFPAAHYRGFYEGFANSVLWPALHSRPDLIRATASDYTAYREINAFLARSLKRAFRAETTYWIHDYHYLPLALELRRLGVKTPIGFFLHTPMPARNVICSIPHHRDLFRAMLAYDLIGFQTQQDLDNFASYVSEDLGLSVVGDVVASARRVTRLRTFPIGIDVPAFASRATKAVASPEVMRLRQSLHGGKLVIGVDRVDYSKGLANRFRAVDSLLTAEPALKRQMTMLQIGVPSREGIDAYCQLQKELAALVGEINGRHGEVDWTPIRYLTKGYSQTTLAGFYRTAAVAMVTPLYDGMNLVAKEYVAAQNPFDPGVLVLSEFAGAAQQLDAALIVNPHDVDGMSQALATALAMPLDERRERWDAMMAVLRQSPVQSWFTDFVDALADSEASIGSHDEAIMQTPVPLIETRDIRLNAKIH